ncbi:MAG: SprT family zinc-dependent metalloprotease [Rhodoferax sp.]|nr:SprT family zinc-dependent metalloprotease [Rhodoferax sp.]MDP3651827.1 SprT family zinc-dependent metalloprotease [Rhodoferax sp.]
MHPLLKYTLDLFDALPVPVAQAPSPVRARKPPTGKDDGSFMPLAPVEPAQTAIKNIANVTPERMALPVQTLGQAIAPARFVHPRANREARLANAVVAYVFERAKRRTIGFVVGPDGLVVRAPKWTPIFEVEAALQEKALWVLRKLGETRERQNRRDEAQIVWRDGAELPFLGESVMVLLDPTHAFKAAGAQLDLAPTNALGLPMGLHTLRVGLSKSASPEQIRDAVQAWLMRQAQQNFKQRLDHFAPLLQVQWRRLGLSNAGTRWGSARTDGSIRLNWRLIHFRQPVIDYVVAHELSHLRVMDHSPRFWDTVRSVVPDYADLRGQLKDDLVPRWK